MAKEGRQREVIPDNRRMQKPREKHIPHAPATFELGGVIVRCTNKRTITVGGDAIVRSYHRTCSQVIPNQVLAIEIWTQVASVGGWVEQDTIVPGHHWGSIHVLRNIKEVLLILHFTL